MHIGVSGHLRQMRDHDDLMGAGQLRQPAPDLHRRPAADAGVDLVEHHRGAGRGSGQHHFQRQHHPGQLATGRALGQRQHRHAAVCREAELNLVDAVAAGPGQLARRATSARGIVGGCGRHEIGGHPDGEFGIGHRQPGQLRGYLFGQLLGRFALNFAEIDCGLG